MHILLHYLRRERSGVCTKIYATAEVASKLYPISAGRCFPITAGRCSQFDDAPWQMLYPITCIPSPQAIRKLVRRVPWPFSLGQGGPRAWSRLGYLSAFESKTSAKADQGPCSQPVGHCAVGTAAIMGHGVVGTGPGRRVADLGEGFNSDHGPAHRCAMRQVKDHAFFTKSPGFSWARILARVRTRMGRGAG